MTYTLFSRLSTKWNESGFQRYFKSTSWAFFAKSVSMVISFLATIYVARNLGPENYGQLSYAISFVGLFGFIGSLGIDYILYRELIKRREERHKLLGTGFVLKLIAGTIAALICTLVAIFVVENDVSKVLIFILALTFILNAFQIINHEFQARVQSKYPSVVSIGVVVILNALKVLVIFNNEGVIYLALILLLESVLYAVSYLYIYKTKLHEKVTKWVFDFAIAKSMLIDSLPLLFSSAFVLLYSRIDQVFIKHMIDVSSVGVYDAAVRLAEVWYVIPSILVTALFPAVINAKETSDHLYFARLKKLAIFLILLACSISAPIAILAPYIMNILYGAAFMEGVIVLQVYVWATIGVFLGALVTNYLVAENLRFALFFTSFLPMVLNIVLNILWIPVYGITGAAFATLISYLFIPLSALFFKTTRSNLLKVVRS